MAINGNVVRVEFKTEEGNGFVLEILGESGRLNSNGLPLSFVAETMRTLIEVLPYFLDKTAQQIEEQKLIERRH